MRGYPGQADFALQTLHVFPFSIRPLGLVLRTSRLPGTPRVPGNRAGATGLPARKGDLDRQCLGEAQSLGAQPLDVHVCHRARELIVCLLLGVEPGDKVWLISRDAAIV